jgi:hypothetical protein
MDHAESRMAGLRCQWQREITSALQLFGNVTFWMFWRDGYAAMSALDDNGDGVLSGDNCRGWRSGRIETQMASASPERSGRADLRHHFDSLSKPGGSAGLKWHARGGLFRRLDASNMTDYIKGPQRAKWAQAKGSRKNNFGF